MLGPCGNLRGSFCKSQRRERWDMSHPLRHLPQIKAEWFLSWLRAAGKAEPASEGRRLPWRLAVATSRSFSRKCGNWREQLQADLTKHKNIAPGNAFWKV